MSEKILPFVIPITDCYPATSEAAGILFADSFIANWMFNNFIQIFQVEENNAIDYYDFAIDNNPFLSYNEINYSFIYHNWNSLKDFIISCINDGYYVRLFNNTNKNPLYDIKREIQHDLLIYGYNDMIEIFFVADHFQSGRFEIKTCSFEVLENAVDTYKFELFEENPAFLNCVQMIRKEDNLMRLRFSMYTPEEMDYILMLNLPRIITSIEDYLNASPTKNWYTRGRVMDQKLAASHKWGIECYDILNLCLNSYDSEGFSLQSFYLMFNHKIVMLERLRRIDNIYELSDFQSFIEKFESLKNLTNILMMSVFKLKFIKQKQALIHKINQKISEIKKLDVEYTTQFLCALKNATLRKN